MSNGFFLTPGLGNGRGASIGNKRIVLLPNRTVVAMRLAVPGLVAPGYTPVVNRFAAFAPCPYYTVPCQPAVQRGGSASHDPRTFFPPRDQQRDSVRAVCG